MRKIMLALVVMLGLLIVATHAAYNAGISHAINGAILYEDEDAILLELDGEVWKYR